MKARRDMAALVLVVGGALLSQAAPPAGYKLVWSDDFESTILDTNKWTHRTDSKHWSTQKPANVSLVDGKLRLTGKKEEAGDKHYTGAGIISRQSFKYGYYEARIKMPAVVGWHTAFWLMKHDGSGTTDPQVTAQELDVCENDSIRLAGYYINNHRFHPEPHKGLGLKFVTTPNLAADFHVYGCEFTPSAAKYFFDGKEVYTVDLSSFPHTDQHIWITTIASHLSHTKQVDDKRLPAIVECDWVRFYEKK